MRAKISAIAASTWQICFIAVALVTITSLSASSEKAITQIKVTNSIDRTIINVRGSMPFTMMPFKGSAGRYLGFQFPVALQAKSRVVGVRSGAIQCVKYSNFRAFPPCSRIVVNTSAHLLYSTEWSADKTTLDITVWKRGYSEASALKMAARAKNTENGANKIAALPVLPSTSVDASAAAVEPSEKPKDFKAPPVRLSAESRKVYAAMRSVGSSALVAYKVASAQPSEPLVTSRVLGIVETETTQPAVAVEPSVKPKDVAAPPVRLSPESRKVYAAMRSVGSSAHVAYTVAATQPTEPLVTSRVLGMVETTKRQPVPVMVARNVESSPVMISEAVASASPAIRKVSLNFLGADINDVLKALSLQSGENIVASKDVTGNVTVSLSNVSIDEAMDYVAKLNGYSYQKENNTYIVTAKNTVVDTKVASESASEVFALHYSKAADVLGILEKLYPDIKVSGSSKDKAGAEGGESSKNTAKAIEFIAISAPESSMGEIRNVVNKLEQSIQTNMASLTTEIYNVKYADPKTIADSITRLIPGVLVGCVPASSIYLKTAGSVDVSIGGGVVVTQGVEQSVDKNPNYQSLILSGPAEQVELAKALAAQLDTKTALINIEAKVTSINKTGALELGLKWDWSQLQYVESAAPRRWIRDSVDFGATLNALAGSGNIKILASPNLLCLDNMPGVFFVGDEVTYIQRIETTATGQNITTATKQVGVQLRVMGDVNSDGYITLNLHPEVSTIKLNVQSGVTLPVVSRRFTDHVVRVKDGETIAIGGLIRSDEIQDLTKVPLLGEVPFLGQLFQHKSKSKTETEVVMFITAKLVKD